jgi:hypothetical protein
MHRGMKFVRMVYRARQFRGVKAPTDPKGSGSNDVGQDAFTLVGGFPAPSVVSTSVPCQELPNSEDPAHCA